MKQLVLLIEDDAAVRNALCQTLELAEYNVIACSAFIEAKDHISAEFSGVVLTDIRMPGRDGFFVLDHVLGCDHELPVVMLTGEGDIPMAVRAIGRGAFDFLEKPCAPDALLPSIERALRQRELILENRALRAQVTKIDPAARMVFGRSELVNALRDKIRLAAKSGADVLVYGEAGTGISKVAEVIHASSPFSTGPFIKRASQGMTRNALMDAFESCQAGSLFLEDIEDLPKDTQLALIDLIEDRGGARIIAGSTQNIDEEALGTSLSSDLYYRLTTMTIRIPALSERPEDIPVMFRHYVAQAAEQSGILAPHITQDVEASVMAQAWPGNARSLMSYAMRFVLGVETTETTQQGGFGLSEQLAQVERRLLIDALMRHQGHASSAAEFLKLPRKTFYDKLSKYEIRSEDYR